MTRPILIQNAQVVFADEVRQADVLLADGKIAEIGDGLRVDNGRAVDGTDLFLTAGWIDLQVNGGFGADFTADPATIWDVAALLPKYGITSFLPTIITSPASQAEQAQAVLAQGTDRPLAMPLGLHLEGPYLNPQKKGAHDAQFMGDPDLERVRSWSPESHVALVTLAPELNNGLEAIELLSKNGVVVSAGHSMATFDQAVSAFSAGARYGTHLFNAMPPLHHRNPGLVGALLEDDRPVVGIIPDGIHVHPALVKMAWESTGRRLNIVTDCMGAMGLGPGKYRLGEWAVYVDESKAQLDDGTLAGSIITLDQALKNFKDWTGCSMPDVIRTVTQTPADLLKLPNKGRLEPGADADCVLISADFEVILTLVGGEIVYDRPNSPLS